MSPDPLWLTVKVGVPVIPVEVASVYVPMGNPASTLRLTFRLPPTVSAPALTASFETAPMSRSRLTPALRLVVASVSVLMLPVPTPGET
jgi:hypothetical protein